ncbi:MAG TPA: DUF1648 domain-containing protein [Hyphomicrobiaceae bacterium]|jgi:uncharacterized membrane protein|nr:DUF1648 domain-containing protein [Hyphomicrobiaceae bacterium]
MPIRRLPLLAFAVVAAWLAGKLLLTWPLLPDRVAVHFNAAGEPDGWAGRASLALQIGGLLAAFALLFAGAGWLDRLPDRYLNLPNRAYWLAPGRRAASMEVLRDWFRWFVVAVLAAVAAVATAALNANLIDPPHFALSLPLVLALILVPTLAMLAWLYRRFRAPPR